LVSELFESFKAKTGAADGRAPGGPAAVALSNDKESAGSKTGPELIAAGPLDYKAGLKKVSAPALEAAKASQSGSCYAAAPPAQHQQPDFKSQLKKTSKSSGLYGGSAAVPAVGGQEEEEGGFLGFKSQLRKVPKPTEVEAGSPSQSDQFR